MYYIDLEFFTATIKAPYCKKGKNHLAIIVWYYGLEFFSTYCKGNAAVMYEIFVDEKSVCYSSEETLSRKSVAYRNHLCKVITNQLGISYNYDATKEDGWMNGELLSFEKSVRVNQSLPLRSRPCEKLALAMASGDGFTVASCFVWMNKDEALSFLSVLTVYLRDIAVYNSTKNTNGLVFSDSILKNAQKFAKINIDKLYRCVTECSSARAHIESGINCALITAQLAIHLCGGKQN